MYRFPDYDEYVSVCSTLTRTYPFLEDRFQIGRKNGARYVRNKILHHSLHSKALKNFELIGNFSNC